MYYLTYSLTVHFSCILTCGQIAHLAEHSDFTKVPNTKDNLQCFCQISGPPKCRVRMMMVYHKGWVNGWRLELLWKMLSDNTLSTLASLGSVVRPYSLIKNREVVCCCDWLSRFRMVTVVFQQQKWEHQVVGQLVTCWTTSTQWQGAPILPWHVSGVRGVPSPDRKETQRHATFVGWVIDGWSCTPGLVEGHHLRRKQLPSFFGDPILWNGGL